MMRQVRMPVLLSCLLLSLVTPCSAQEAEAAARIGADVAYLASDLLEGRAIGSAGGDSASLFIARRYAELGVRGAFLGQCASAAPCGQAYFQLFELEGIRAENVVAFVPGADPELRSRFVVVGAHYDHLGRIGEASLDPQRGRVIRPGADDNASGTAAALELGRRLASRPAPVSVLLAHFDAEELGMIGSGVFVENSPVALDSISLMINLDMIGRLRDRQLMAEVTPPAEPLRPGIDRIANSVGLPLQPTRATRARSDHVSFSSQCVPAVALFTGIHGDYHRATDTPDKVDVAGVLRVVDLAEALVRSAATLAGEGRVSADC